MIDFYTLEAKLVNKLIAELKNSEFAYSLLGRRVFKSESESCATASYICLEAGGIENLLRIDDRFLSKRGILTPYLLNYYAVRAQKQEQAIFPKSVELSKQSIEERTAESNRILLNFYKEMGITEEQLENHDLPKRGPSK
jgi:hypothetical protein